MPVPALAKYTSRAERRHGAVELNSGPSGRLVVKAETVSVAELVVMVELEVMEMEEMALVTSRTYKVGRSSSPECHLV